MSNKGRRRSKTSKRANRTITRRKLRRQYKKSTVFRDTMKAGRRFWGSGGALGFEEDLTLA